MFLDDFKKQDDWTKVWSGKWSLNSCSQFGQAWTVNDLVAGKVAYPKAVYVQKRGIADCWVSHTDKDDLGQRLTKQFRTNPGMAKKLASNLNLHTDIFFAFLKKHKKIEANLDTYTEFWKIISDYYLPHLSVKYIVDYLSPTELKKHLPVLEEARLYAEPVFREQENFVEKIAAQISKKSGVPKELVLCATIPEIKKYFKGSKFPSIKILKERFLCSAEFIKLGKSELFSGKKAFEMEKLLHPKPTANGEIKGQTAFKGKVAGTARLVIDPKKYKGIFNIGDILVTGMTRPEFLPYMKKASGFITDAGGILSHAAIMARELKKPCIIGTKIATKILKDGDIIEVDANKGIIKIIKK